MGDGGNAAVSSSSGNSEGASQQHREATRGEKERAPMDAQIRQDKAVLTDPPSAKETGVAAGALEPSRYSASKKKRLNTDGSFC
jgi:hypothetical protein